jgi:hypothetical protein
VLLTVLVTQERERMQVEEEENSRNLLIRRLEDTDKGLYTCQVNSRFFRPIEIIETLHSSRESGGTMLPVLPFVPVT